MDLSKKIGNRVYNKKYYRRMPHGTSTAHVRKLVSKEISEDNDYQVNYLLIESLILKIPILYPNKNIHHIDSFKL